MRVRFISWITWHVPQCATHTDKSTNYVNKYKRTKNISINRSITKSYLVPANMAKRASYCRARESASLLHAFTTEHTLHTTRTLVPQTQSTFTTRRTHLPIQYTHTPTSFIYVYVKEWCPPLWSISYTLLHRLYWCKSQ